MERRKGEQEGKGNEPRTPQWKHFESCMVADMAFKSFSER
jgi:hypothetical protein